MWCRRRTRILVELAGAVVIGLLIGWAAGRFDPVPDEQISAPAAGQSDVSLEQGEEMEGSVHVYLPEWVEKPGQGRPGRNYRELGGSPSAPARRRPEQDPRVVPHPDGQGGVVGGEPVRGWGGNPALVQRAGGERLMAFDFLTPGGGSVADGEWAVAGACSSSLIVRNGRGIQQGMWGEWIFTLAVPRNACGEERAAHARRSPTAAERRELSHALGASPLAVYLNGTYASEDVVDITVVQGDDDRIAFGVVRSEAQTTRVYPPPQRRQAAFVARHGGPGWLVLWVRPAASGENLLSLAGALRQQGGWRGIYPVRTDEGVHVLEVAEIDGAWKVADVRPLGRP